MAEFKPNYGNSASQNTLSSNDADDTARTPQVINVPHQHKNQGIDNKIPGICVEDTSHDGACFDLRNSTACSTNDLILTTKTQVEGDEEKQMLKAAMEAGGINMEEAYTAQMQYDQRAQSKQQLSKLPSDGKVKKFDLENCWFEEDLESVNSYPPSHITCDNSVLSDISLMFMDNINDKHVIKIICI